MSGSIGSGSAGLRHVTDEKEREWSGAFGVIEVPVVLDSSTGYADRRAHYLNITVADLDVAIKRGAKNNGYRLVRNHGQLDGNGNPSHERCDAALVDFCNGHHGILYRDKRNNYGIDVYITANSISRLEKQHYPHNGEHVACFLNGLLGRFPPSAHHKPFSPEGIPGRPMIMQAAVPESLPSRTQPVLAAPLPVAALS